MLHFSKITHLIFIFPVISCRVNSCHVLSTLLYCTAWYREDDGSSQVRQGVLQSGDPPAGHGDVHHRQEHAGGVRGTDAHTGHGAHEQGQGRRARHRW